MLISMRRLLIAINRLSSIDISARAELSSGGSRARTILGTVSLLKRSILLDNYLSP